MTKSRICLAACVDDPHVHACDPTRLIIALHTLKHKYKHLQDAEPDHQIKVFNITIAIIIRDILRIGSKKKRFWLRCVLNYLNNNGVINGKILDTNVAEQVITLAVRRAYCRRI